MKLATGQINQFLQKPDAAMRVVLIYGPDSGLVRERGDVLAKKIVDDLADPFRVALLTSPMIADDPARLADEMKAQSLGGGRRLVRVAQATDAIAGALASFLGDIGDGDSLLILEGGDLEKRSKLRTLCEGEGKNICAIPCYVEDGPARQRIIGEILQTANLRAPREVILFLAEILPPDRMALRSELEKFILYAQGKTAITIEDARASVQDAGAAEIDDLVYAVGSGEAKRAALLLDRLLAEQTSPVAILRATQRHFTRLAFARAHMDKGASASDAVQRLQPPVFWKYKDSMAAQLRRWHQPNIENALTKLCSAEAAVKRTGTPDTILCAQLLIEMAGRN
jgi:DNA polymerase-3 subunit delta